MPLICNDAIMQCYVVDGLLQYRVMRDLSERTTAFLDDGLWAYNDSYSSYFLLVSLKLW